MVDGGLETWVPGPNGRGTLEIIFSCILTFVFCVWCALHVNVPPPDASDFCFAREKTIWVLYGIFAPELVIATAASQYLSACWLWRERQEDERHGLGPGWSMAQCFFIEMGGCAVDIPATWRVGGKKVEDAQDEGPCRVILTPAAVRLLSFMGKAPKIEESYVNDKSNADWLAKSIVLLQSLWFLTQVIGRLIDRLPISLLEINTCGHVICAFFLYLLWWNKPYDIREPKIIDECTDDFALMYLCSRISWTDGKICPIRCLYFNKEGAAFNQQGAMRQGGIEFARTDEVGRSYSEASIELSTGTNALWDVEWFSGGNVRTKSVPAPGQNLIIQDTFPLGAADCCKGYMSEDYQRLAFRHGDMYCRLHLDRLKTDAMLDEFELVPPEVLEKVSGILQQIYAECRQRQEKAERYMKLYFTTISPVSKVNHGTYVSETDYLVHWRRNRPELWNLRLGQTDISENVLPAVFAFTALAYGGLHLSAWNDFFPTQTERILWYAAAMTIAVSGGVVWVYSSSMWMRQKYQRSQRTTHAKKPLREKLGRVLKTTALVIVGCSFVVARIYIIIEAFVGLRVAPKGIYVGVDWSKFFPHFK